MGCLGLLDEIEAQSSKQPEQTLDVGIPPNKYTPGAGNISTQLIPGDGISPNPEGGTGSIFLRSPVVPKRKRLQNLRGQ